MEYRKLIDYFIKDLSPDEQRGIHGYIQDYCNSSYAKRYAKHQDEDYLPCLKSGVFDSVEQLKNYLNIYSEHFIAVNNRMMKNGRAPLFKEPLNLKQSFEWVDLLLTFDKAERWNRLLNCNSFDDYKPELCESGLTSVIDLFHFDRWTYNELLLTLTTKILPKTSVEGGIAKNIYEYSNLIFALNQVKPLFENTDDLEGCIKKRNEILKVQPLKNALAVLNCSTIEDLTMQKATKTCLAIYKYTYSNYGETNYKTTYNYEIGWRIREILSQNITSEKVCQYATEINYFCVNKIFDDPSNCERCKNLARTLVRTIHFSELNK